MIAFLQMSGCVIIGKDKKETAECKKTIKTYFMNIIDVSIAEMW